MGLLDFCLGCWHSTRRRGCKCCRKCKKGATKRKTGTTKRKTGTTKRKTGTTKKPPTWFNPKSAKKGAGWFE